MFRSFPTHGGATGWQAASRFLYRCTERFVDAVRARPGDPFETLDRLPLCPEARDAFDRARYGGGELALPDDVVFPPSAFPLTLTFADASRAERFTLTVEDADTLAAIRSALSGDWRGSRPGDDDFELAAQLQEAGVLSPDTARPIDWSERGIYRLQHASLLFRSEGATVLSDPVFADDSFWAGNLPHVDAIVISHGHGDHFCLPSLMQFPRDTLIVVPRTDRPSMLADDLEALLRHAGFENVLAASWGSSVRVGDIDIHVYPFYGEQPWVTFPAAAPGLRNAGNTYLVDCDGFRSWLLIDSGREYGRDMVEVAQRVRAEHGAPDLVLSNLRVFPWHPGQIDGSGRYLFCFPRDRLGDPSRWPTGINITLGSDGARELLRACDARAFLPYAHWWHRPGSGPHIVDGMVREADMVAAIGATDPPPARLSTWSVGDRVDRDLRCHPFLSKGNP